MLEDNVDATFEEIVGTIEFEGPDFSTEDITKALLNMNIASVHLSSILLQIKHNPDTIYSFDDELIAMILEIQEICDEFSTAVMKCDCPDCRGCDCEGDSCECYELDGEEEDN